MTRHFKPCAGILVAFLFLQLAAPYLRASGNTNHYVFAHYMVCFATYGESIEGYKREILQAQAAGIDGFALNVGAWSGPDTYYKSRVKLMYDAAEQLGADFKLFFSVDLGQTNDIVDMVATYGTRPNSFRYNGKVVLSTFGLNGLNWRNGIFEPLRKRGIEVFFVPHFWSDTGGELPQYRDGVNVLNTYSNILDGLFLFGAAGLPYQLAQCNSNYTRAVHEAGKIFMAGMTPHYWGYIQPSVGRRYFESDGGEGTVLQWRAIIANQPDWVEIVTWNDFNESTYISPVEDPGRYFDYLITPRRYSHKGYLELSKRFITWYKTGKEPAVDRDALFYFYRTHPKNAVASNTNDIPVKGFIGNIQDTIYTTVFLTAPAQLEIISGKTLTTNSLPAGMSQIQTPFTPGPQIFAVKRNGTLVLFAQGPDIMASIQNYDFFPASGYAYGKPAVPR